MTVKVVLTAWIGFVLAYAQTTPPDPAVANAQMKVDRLRELLAVGAASRVQLEKAEAEAADARDVAFLRQTLYLKDLTPEQADEIVTVTQRRLERSQQMVTERQKLLDAGLISKSELEPLVEGANMARHEHDLAISRANLIRQLAEMARLEAQAEPNGEFLEHGGMAARYDGSGVFTTRDFRIVESAFFSHFARVLPVSAQGETAVHRALGFDHRGRVDVAINPDQPEGLWLRQYLESRHIPYFAFRTALPGKATGAHIHIGPMSTHIL